MAVDEFGREIPAGRGGRGSPPRYGAEDPAFFNDGFSGFRSEDAPPPSRHYNSNSNSYNPDHRSIRKRKHQRDESPEPPNNNSSNTNRRFKNNLHPHPSTLYADEPMQCQVLWNPNANGNTENHSQEGSREYDEYRKAYCLNYIRTFFNQHMDDSWFRALYSPLEEQRVALQERNRAAREANAFKAELETSLAKNAGDGKCFFVLKARLGGGVKQQHPGPTRGGSSNDYSPSRPALSNPVPGTHVFSIVNQVLPIHDVPPHVTDQQIVLALLANVAKLKPDDVQIFSSTVPGYGNLFRTAYVYCTEEIRKEIIQQLNHADRATLAPPTNVSAHHVPRKEDTHIPKQLELEVDCSDAYGRMTIDTDGKGGVGGTDEGVPPRKATLFVSTQTTSLTPNIAVLSAAVSSKAHIAKDMKAAHTLAKAHDIRRNIPPNTRFETLLPQAIPGFDPDTASPQDMEDALDLAIAYLRRVHLFSFYNGCSQAPRVADVLNRTHAVSTIHLRLGIADEILQPTTTTTNTTTADATPAATSEEPPKVDLLVQRHEESIQKALAEAQPWLDDPTHWGQIILTAEKDAEAQRIAREEKDVEPMWIQDHSLIDEDGRARCSFHFCRKLFKDYSFLKKHLLKKHSEFLVAERAKCHDRSMMQAWDAQEQRPVPPVLVDCGRNFSLVPSPVLGAETPLAEDPEPELWRREEERRQQEEQLRKERQERFQPPPTSNNGEGSSEYLLQYGLSEDRPNPHHHHSHDNPGGPPPPRRSNFVDVDDMKEEKVELDFENVEIPLLPPKKKKKKKLL